MKTIKNLAIGMAIGATLGAVYVQGNRKAQSMIKKGKNVLKNQIDEMK
jgi:hypothetical protein